MALYQALFAMLYTRCRDVAPKHRFRFKNSLFFLDSTTISLCLSLCPWARFRTTKGAIKVHTLLDHAGHVPAVVVLTEGKRRDLAVARGLYLPVDSIVTMDRGDIAYQLLFPWHQQGVYVVTRQKVNAHVHVTARFAVDRSTGVTADHDIVLTGANGRASPARLRQVRYRDAATGKRDVFWTIAVHLAATTIAAIDKQRWPIELFLKAITQHLWIKTFWGTSENAVMTQAWVTLITYRIQGFLRFKAGWGISFQHMLRLLQINLFERRNLIDLCMLQPPDVAGRQPLCAM
jgi:DDE family transposase